MIASDPISTLSISCKQGAVHICELAHRGCQGRRCCAPTVSYSPSNCHKGLVLNRGGLGYLVFAGLFLCIPGSTERSPASRTHVRLRRRCHLTAQARRRHYT